MLGELREDFDRWWVTASLHEKVSMGLTVTIMVMILLGSFSNLVRALRGVG